MQKENDFTAVTPVFATFATTNAWLMRLSVGALERRCGRLSERPTRRHAPSRPATCALSMVRPSNAVVSPASASDETAGFGSALNLNVHLHTVVPDGTFAIDDRPSFVALSPSHRTRSTALKSFRERVHPRGRSLRQRRRSPRDPRAEMGPRASTGRASCGGCSQRQRPRTSCARHARRAKRD